MPTRAESPGDGIRCLVWDLDNTLWSGTLLESDDCRLRPGVRQVLAELDGRGILLSVASANEPELALAVLRRKGLEDYFLHPQVGWNSKVRSIQTIASELDIALDTVGFIDDEPFERAQVQHLLPEVRTYPAEASRTLPDRPEFTPSVLTAESRKRRQKYRQALARADAEATSRLTRQEFLEYCRTHLTVRAAVPPDLDRIVELMRRTHQLNATGSSYEPSRVATWLSDERWCVRVAELEDRFVDYGRVGVAVCRCTSRAWELMTFLVSCRVLSRGITGSFLACLVGEAHRAGALHFRCRYRPSGRNHRLETLYKLAGFRPVHQYGNGTIVYEKQTVKPPPAPNWLTVNGVCEP